jgi:hypothetical protein
MIKITGKSLQKITKRTPNKIVFFHECGDWTNDNKLIFEEAEIAVFYNCDKNFMYYWLSPIFFPKLKTVYMDRVCDNEIFRFKNINVYTRKYSYNKCIKSLYNCPANNVNIELFDDEHFDTLQKLANIE